jgi:glycosyltransferase involved in cell wall biosynthesis
VLTNISGYQIDILVVENNQYPDEHVRKIINTYDKSERCVQHLLEPIRGIPHARNAALNFAKDKGYNYLAFIDDDAFASLDWIKTLVKVNKNAHVTAGPQLAIFPEGTSLFYRNAAVYHERAIVNGSAIKWAATNNILIDISFMEAKDLSFNPKLINGGEDKELFLRVNKSRGKLIWSDTAFVSEYIAQSRLSIKWATRRTFRIGATGFMIESSVKTPFRTYLSCIFKGAMYLAKGVLFFPYHAISPKSSALNSLCDLSHGIGFFYGLFSKGRVSKYT